MIGFSRWSGKGNTHYIYFYDGPGPTYSITHYTIEDNVEVPHSFILEHVSGGVYSYTVNDEDFTDSFKIYSNDNLIVEFVSSKEPGTLTVKDRKNRAIPRHKIESAGAKETIYRLNSPLSKYIYYNSYPITSNSISVNFDISNFDGVNSVNPQVINREQLNTLLDDPLNLFTTENGTVYSLEEENKIVTIYSNGDSAWFEEVDFKDYYNVQHYSDDYIFESNFVTSKAPIPVGVNLIRDDVLSPGCGSIDSSYNEGEVPIELESEVPGTIANIYSVTIFGFNELTESFVNYSINGFVR